MRGKVCPLPRGSIFHATGLMNAMCTDNYMRIITIESLSLTIKCQNHIKMKTSEEVNIPTVRNGSVLHLLGQLHQHLTENKSLGALVELWLIHNSNYI